MTEPDFVDNDLPKVVVNVAAQRMDLIEGGEVKKTYRISTSRYGLGTEPGSYKTPTGRFRVAEKYGDDAPLGAVFKSRVATGEVAEQGGEEDHILTRILWLEGLEEQNANTHERYIYIHGTNQEHLLGEPASHGCVRMANADIAEFYSLVPSGAQVEIVA